MNIIISDINILYYRTPYFLRFRNNNIIGSSKRSRQFDIEASIACRQSFWPHNRAR